MKYIVPFLTIFAILTQPDGKPVFLAKDQIVAVTSPNGDCVAGSKAVVVTVAGKLCVAEPPGTAAALLER